MLKDFKYHITIPVILLLFGLSMALSYNIAKAWTNPASSPPIESLTPIAVVNGGTAASSTSQARLNLGAAASGANSDITSLSPSGNLIISPTGGVGIGTTSLISGATVTVNGNLVTTGELQSTLASGDGQIRMIAGNYGAMWRNDGTNTWFLLTASGSQYGSWNSLRPMQISDSSGEVYMANGLDITSGGITFPDGTVQTTAYVSPASGSQLWTTPGTYSFTVPTGVTRLTVIAVGPGGYGGPGPGPSAGGGGGGGGILFAEVTPGQLISFTVGQSTYSAEFGTATTIFGFTFSGGGEGDYTGQGNGGVGGTATAPGSFSGDYWIASGASGGGAGGMGGTGFLTTSANGGPSDYSSTGGGGGGATPVAGIGGAGTSAYGSAGGVGSGGGGSAGSGDTGGAGGNGEVIIYW